MRSESVPGNGCARGSLALDHHVASLTAVVSAGARRLFDEPCTMCEEVGNVVIADEELTTECTKTAKSIRRCLKALLLLGSTSARWLHRILQMMQAQHDYAHGGSVDSVKHLWSTRRKVCLVQILPDS